MPLCISKVPIVSVFLLTASSRRLRLTPTPRSVPFSLSPPTRYLWGFNPIKTQENFYFHWDEDIGTTQDVLINIYVQDIATSELSFYLSGDRVRIGGGKSNYLHHDV